MGNAGLVVPAYEPDVDVLVDYVDALLSLDEVSDVHIEIDAPGNVNLDRLAETGASLHVANQRRGKGAAITHGFDALDNDILAFADADGSTAPSSVADVVRAVERGADLAVGSRRHPDADVRDHQTVLRRYLGDGFSSLAQVALDVDLYDYQCGVKAMTATAWDRIRGFLTEPGFAWDVEVIGFAGHLGMEIREIPVEWEDHADSTVDPLPTVIEMGQALVRTRARTSHQTWVRNTVCQAVIDEDPLVDQ